MESEPVSKTTTVRLTSEEIDTLLHALKIAAEDGSIYPTRIDEAEDDAATKRMNGLIEGIQRKLTNVR